MTCHKKLSHVLGTVLLTGLLASSAHAQTSVPHVFTDGTPARASEINLNFDTLETAIDGVGVLGGGGNSNYGFGTDLASLTPGTPESFSGKTNIAIGGSALDSLSSGWGNVGIGHLAANGLETGRGNVVVGYAAHLLKSESSYNVALGYQAMGLATAGSSNVAIGYQALYSGTQGSDNHNVAIGTEAGREAGGVDSIFIGRGAGQTVFGAYNTAVGAQSLWTSTNAWHNTALGYNSLYRNDTGDENTALGHGALADNTTGSNNVGLGYNADVASGNLSNAVAIGSGATVNASNKIRLGNNDVTVIEGAVGFNEPSDRRLKENIRPLDNGLAIVRDLRAVTYHKKQRNDQSLEMGIIAQELKQVLDKHGLSASNMVHQASADAMMSVRYDDLFAPLIGAVQALDQRVSEQNKLLAEQADRLQRLEERLGISAR